MSAGFAKCERLRFIIHDSECHEQKKRDEHQPSREQHLHPKNDTTGSDCSSGLRQNVFLETGFPRVVREPQVNTARMGRLGLGRRGPPKTRQQRNTMHWKSIGKNDREAASKKLLSEEKKKDPEEKRGGVQKTRGRKAWKSFGLSCKKGHQGRAK